MSMSITTAYMIDEEPGDGTRYTLSVVPAHGGGFLVGWYATGAMWWADHHPGGDVLLKSCPRELNKTMQAASAQVGKLLDRHVRGKVNPRHDRLIIGLIDGLRTVDVLEAYLDGWFGKGAGKRMLEDAIVLLLVTIDGDQVQLTRKGRERAVVMGVASAPFLGP